MWWVEPPAHTSLFSVRTGDGKWKDDSKNYHPGGLTNIHVRALSQGVKYRGLLLYAVNSKGEKVGSWELPPEVKKDFHTPPGSCAGMAVMHSGAEMKNYHNVFPFRAPPEGTGKIRFLALVKVGGANTGTFYWPNAKKPLSLSEGAPHISAWRRSESGQSCTAACRAYGGCNEAQLRTVQSATSFEAVLAQDFSCKLPLLRAQQCRAQPSEGSGYFCSYGCEKTAATCGAKVEGTKRFCPCNNAEVLVEALHHEAESEDEDQWSERNEWDEIKDQAVIQEAVGGKAVLGCEHFSEKAVCENNGCVFSKEEGAVVCATKSRFPLNVT